MACFLVPAAEAVVVTVIRRRVAKRQGSEQQEFGGVFWPQALAWLSNLLWGGSFLLAIEHIWHGEVVPWPPFLTAMNSPVATSEMLHEMATVGVSMAVLVTAVWAIMVAVSTRRAKAAAHVETAVN
ncbi:hypothetical protein GCM10009785_19980 [Brooklawnia cerclae]|uniref:Uncharacterized protein n=1 Tax=Brooklawnia cerclae TaxID=349934 RepID=A0ABX0SFU4_9ACTN|nr:hypothetical protein [Brooklawnia cerclae]NIH57260.1 hypothetical protein [Brooklawnia cerclae]